MSEAILKNAGIEQFDAYDTLWIGFSGGLDSSVLLHLLSQVPALRGKLHAIHVHHGISPYADQWQSHCVSFCQYYDIPIIIRRVQLNQAANLEASARQLRYQVFSDYVQPNDALLLAHHQDDQAETLLLQILRGTGIDGLAGMLFMKPWQQAVLIRPLLTCSRAQLSAYAHAHQLFWIEDESNLDSRYTRNFIRHELMPLLQTRWPSARQNLARTAAHCQEAQANLATLAAMDHPLIDGTCLSLQTLNQFDRARQSNVLRQWLKKNQVPLRSEAILTQIVDNLIRATSDRNPVVHWDKFILQRYQDTLYLRLVNQTTQDIIPKQWSNFPYAYGLDAARVIRAIPAAQGLIVPPDASIEIRYRQGGEQLYWHGQTKSLKKLLQEWKVLPWERDVMPLIYIHGKLAAVGNRAISDHFYGSDSAYQLEIANSDEMGEKLRR